MGRSFYHYLMSERNPKGHTTASVLANLVDKDISFPKHSEEYEEVSSYLELEGYLPSMSLFDEVWAEYLEKNK
ncbi:Uncharacterized protein YozE, UPF0346 family [Pilibacter termitis]|uniref:UPF0346 protein SAMN02745116_01507 n=1 Tax=Pilibacter termitis TaxID=263852 RepID=A0A1T4NQ69_9ENTE|nr:YozE family protein [Pilibacter termitis]SJZ81430.1 Uncharacterized protein YozE, UPF0346 family [Pilibacter termitis]